MESQPGYDNIRMKIVTALASSFFVLGILATDPLIPETLAADIKTVE
jgi:hypothetical protein